MTRSLSMFDYMLLAVEVQLGMVLVVRWLMGY